MGTSGLGFAGKVECSSEGDETNIVVMKPDMAFDSPRAYQTVSYELLSRPHSSD